MPSTLGWPTPPCPTAPPPPPVISVSITPSSGTIPPLGTLLFTATVTNATNQSVTWTADQGTIDPTGFYTAPNVSASTTANITATSNADPTKSATAQVAIQFIANVLVVINPAGGVIPPGGTIQFTATVTNIADQSVVWSLQPGTPGVPAPGPGPVVGTISPTGLYRAPATLGVTSYDDVIARSVAYPVAAGLEQVTVLVNTVVTVLPGNATVGSGETLQFTATVVGTANQAVTWTASIGSISSTGLYTAPTNVTVATAANITATSVADPTASATVPVSIQVSPVITVVVIPAGASLGPNQQQQFLATVGGPPGVSQAVTWSVPTTSDPLLPAGGGTITSGGLYTAPPTVILATTISIQATSVADPTAQSHSVIILSAGGVPPTQLDLVQWMVISTRATQHMVGDPSAPYYAQMLDTDPGYPPNYPRGIVWQIKNKLGHPWDVHSYDSNWITHWITENGDSVDQAACQAANGTTCWMYNRAYKRYVAGPGGTPGRGVNTMPRFFTPGTTITVDNPSPNDVARTTNCEATSTAVHIGPVRGVTTGPFKISWAGSIDHGTGTLATGPNYDPVNGVDTIRNQYMYGSGFSQVEEYYYVLGFGQVAWYHYSNGVFQQKTVNTTLAAGGAPIPDFPCGPGKSWFV